MRTGSARILSWAIAALCVLTAGCTLCENARRTMCIEPRAFHWKKDKERSLAVYSAWADEAWGQELVSCPELGGSVGYGIGFRDGFVDYVYAGGTGEPPPVPPRELWNVDLRSEEGHRQSEEWFAGYRHGAQVARDGGYRSLATVRSSILGVERRRPTIYGEEFWQGGGYGHHESWSDSEPLPAPTEADAPELHAPQTPREFSAPNETTTPPPEAPREETAAPAPATRPAVPPPPRNLPPTTPRPLPPPGEGMRLEDNDAGFMPAAPPRATTPPIEPTPIPLPLDSGEAEELRSSSLRVIGVTRLVDRRPRALPPMKPAPSPIRPKTIGGGTPPPGPIRLTVATSAAEPPASAVERTTIKIRSSASE